MKRIAPANSAEFIIVDEEEAAREYDSAAKKYHGEFACINF